MKPIFLSRNMEESLTVTTSLCALLRLAALKVKLSGHSGANEWWILPVLNLCPESNDTWYSKETPQQFPRIESSTHHMQAAP